METALIVVFSNRIAFHSVQSHACSVVNSELKISQTPFFCHFTAVFHVMCRCFIIGRRFVETRLGL